MRKALAALAIAAAATPAWAEWRPVAQNENGTTYYVDRSTLRVYGSTRSAWTLVNYQEADSQGAGSYKALSEFDCAGGRLRNLQTTYYDEQMGSGKPRPVTAAPDSWAYAIPGTAAGILLERVCSLS